MFINKFEKYFRNVFGNIFIARQIEPRNSLLLTFLLVEGADRMLKIRLAL